MLWYCTGSYLRTHDASEVHWLLFGGARDALALRWLLLMDTLCCGIALALIRGRMMLWNCTGYFLGGHVILLYCFGYDSGTYDALVLQLRLWCLVQTFPRRRFLGPALQLVPALIHIQTQILMKRL